ncbi:MAG: hypothetical protein R3Y11_10565 [Pseudomonadota bacterium]
MAGIDSISKGLTSVMNDDANLRNFKISGGEVKERSGLGKLFARLSDHFSAKSTGGRLQIAERNAAIGDAMLKMVNNRVDAKLGRLDAKVAEAANQGLEPNADAVAAKKENITAMVKTLTDKIATLSQSKDISQPALQFLRGVKEPQIKDKMLNVINGVIDKKATTQNLRTFIDGTVNEDGLKGFDLDARRGMVKCPGLPSRGTPEAKLAAVHAHVDDITRNAPEVKKFIINTCYQSGVPFSITSQYIGMGVVKDANIPSFDELAHCGAAPGDVPDQGNPIYLTTRDDGSIDIKCNINSSMRNTHLEDAPAFSVRTTTVRIHLPVDTDGNFIVENGYPQYNIEDIAVSNQEL